MATSFVPKNGSKTESSINTIIYDNIEVPDSQLAKRVWLVRAELDPDVPDYVAASSTYNHSFIGVGKLSPTTPELSEAGMVGTKKICRASNGSSGYAVIVDGPDQIQGRFEIFKSPDGKFYVTVGTKGTNNTAVRTVYYRLDFEVEY